MLSCWLVLFFLVLSSVFFWSFGRVWESGSGKRVLKRRRCERGIAAGRIVIEVFVDVLVEIEVGVKS